MLNSNFHSVVVRASAAALLLKKKINSGSNVPHADVVAPVCVRLS